MPYEIDTEGFVSQLYYFRMLFLASSLIFFLMMVSYAQRNCWFIGRSRDR